MEDNRKTQEGKEIDGIIDGNPGGQYRDGNDHKKLRQGRMANVGFKIGQYVQTPPMFFTRDGHTVPLIDRYRGCPAFLITGGPSFATVDKAPLTRPGVLTMGYNNVVKVFRTNMWCGIDSPSHFLSSIWTDPRIEKFVPFDHAEKPVVDSYTRSEIGVVGDYANVWYFRRNEYFNAERYLHEDTINWGNHGDYGGARSGVLAAVRILYLLGIRTLYLLGFDYKMDPVNKYCFDQDRSTEAIDNNNATYREMIPRWEQLRPIFERRGFNVFNCNPNSDLKVFEFVDYEKAIEHCTSALPDIENEPTKGFYESAAKKAKTDVAHQKAVVDAAHGVAPEKPVAIDPTLTLQQAKINKKAATEALNEAKKQLDELDKLIKEQGDKAAEALLAQYRAKLAQVSELRDRRKTAIETFNKLDVK
jgi:hypothetical protein